MELCETDLEGFLKKPKPSFSQRLGVSCDIAKGLCQIHNVKVEDSKKGVRPMMHRDIKPANIFIVKGVAKLGDLGLAREPKAQQQQTFCGTEKYIAPEIESGNYDHTVDLYSFGEMMKLDIFKKEFEKNDLEFLPLHDLILELCSAKGFRPTTEDTYTRIKKIYDGQNPQLQPVPPHIIPEAVATPPDPVPNSPKPVAVNKTVDQLKKSDPVKNKDVHHHHKKSDSDKHKEVKRSNSKDKEKDVRKSGSGGHKEVKRTYSKDPPKKK